MPTDYCRLNLKWTSSRSRWRSRASRGVFGYYWFSETRVVLRVLMVLAGLVAAAGVA